MTRFQHLTASVVASLAMVGAPPQTTAAPGDLITTLPAAGLAQGIARDTEDGTYWVSTAALYEIYHYSADLTEQIGAIPLPVECPVFPQVGGVAFNSLDQTLLVAISCTKKIYELERDGTPTGRVINFRFPPDSHPIPGGMAFDPAGADSKGTVFLVVSREVFEITLDAELVRSFAVLPESAGTSPAPAAGTD